jgi:hypothetical protein
MNTHLAAVIFSLLIQLPSTPATPQKEIEKGSIEGVVTRATTGDPLARAQVTLSRMAPPQAPPAPGQATPTNTAPLAQIPQIFTESDGKFLFKDLDPGQYRIQVRVNGYANQEYGQRVVFGPGTPFSLAAGQTMRDIVFKMIQDGTVTGHVRDSKGDPVPGLTVSLFRSIYNTLGTRTLSSAGAGISDDRGEYRAFFVPPGRYYVGIAPTSSAVQILVLGNNVLSDRTFPTTYYPSALDTAHATAIEVQPGLEINGIDILLTLPTTYRIRGKVVDGVTGVPPKSFSVGLSMRVDPNAPTSNDSVRYTSTTDPTNGTFEVRNVMPGAYWLRATMSSNLDDPLPANIVTAGRSAIEVLDSVLLGNRGTAQIPVDVSNSDLENANITMTPTISVPLQVNVENMQLSQLGGVDRIRLNLRSTNPSSPSSSQRSAFNEDGRSTVENVSPGEYRIQMGFGAQPDLYLKDARFGVKQILTEPFQISSQSSEILSITLSNGGGRIDGTLTNGQTKPEAGIQVVLIPDETRDRTELYKNTTTDPSGHFTLRGIPPGNYKLFAWEAIEIYSYFDRDVLSKYESQGKQVKITEGTKEMVEMKIIPAAKQ